MDPSNCRVSFDTFLKKPDEGDIEIYTDASGEIGVGGIIGDSIAFQIRWAKTIWNEVLAVRPELDIQVQEAIGPLIALQIARELLRDKSVSIYNDNPGAAAALISKAPPLWRSDMQFITREIAMLAVKNNIMYWGIKIDGKHNEYADALSRFYTKYDWNKLGYKLVDVTDITNDILFQLMNYYPNRDKRYWKWTEQQKKDLYIKRTESLIEDKATRKTRAKKNPPIHNILTKENFDDFLEIIN